MNCSSLKMVNFHSNIFHERANPFLKCHTCSTGTWRSTSLLIHLTDDYQLCNHVPLVVHTSHCIVTRTAPLRTTSHISIPAAIIDWLIDWLIDSSNIHTDATLCIFRWSMFDNSMSVSDCITWISVQSIMVITVMYQSAMKQMLILD